MQDLRYRLNRFAGDCNMDCCNVTTANLQEWLDNQKLSPQGYTNFRRVLNLLFKFAVAAIFMLSAQFCVVTSIRTADISAVVPFRYSAILWSLLISYAVWGDVPDRWTLLGIFIIASAGLYVFFREQTLRRQAIAAASGTDDK